MTLPTDPTTVLTLTERSGWPRAQLPPPASMGTGEDIWRHVGLKASPERLAEAHAALLALAAHPTEPITPRLV
jgi:hypothetical protein